MSKEFELAEDFILPLFDEIFVVKERDFSIEYNPLGSGLKKLLVLVSSTSEEYLVQEELLLLQTILEKGLRHTLNDVWIVNLERFPSKDQEALWDYFQPTRVLVWGCDAWLKGKGIKANLHQFIYFKGVELLVAGELKTYLTDTTAKARLWAGLQRMFYS